MINSTTEGIEYFKTIKQSKSYNTCEFIDFHYANPHVFTKYRNYAYIVFKRGLRKSSSELIFNRLRWFEAVQTTDPLFKLNNNYKPYYARLLMSIGPFKENNFFDLRKSAADDLSNDELLTLAKLEWVS
tara:strand:+ start:397 stop:783 length:387 start_codon:yes stop_codon:yes gene_type:complete